MKDTKSKKTTTLKRAVNPMPRNIRALLVEHKLLERYKE
jgi:hypothetical protein